MAESAGNGIAELRKAAADLHDAITFFKNSHGVWRLPEPSLPAEATGWNFVTFEKFINQRFIDQSLNLRERYEAQQTGLAAALAAAEKAVQAALTAAEKAVDKAEAAQQLRNEAQNEFRKSLSDLSGLMWQREAGQAAMESLRREALASDTNVSDRTSKLEAGYNNLQGRIWAVSATFLIVTVIVSVLLRYIGH